MLTLEVDNAELSKRLVEMKMTEIDRMNDVNKLCDEMMLNARNMERAAAAESSSRQVLGKFFNAGKANGLRQGMTTVRVPELLRALPINTQAAQSSSCRSLRWFAAISKNPRGTSPLYTLEKLGRDLVH